MVLSSFYYCRNKIPYTRWLKQQKFNAVKPKIKVLADLDSVTREGERVTEKESKREKELSGVSS